MRAVISAIIAACKTAFASAAKVILLPFSLFGSGAPSEPPEIEMPQPFETAPARRDMTAMYDEIAKAITGWAADSIIDDTPAPVPPMMPREIRDWLPGLTRAECDALLEADQMAISGHIQRLFPLPGVRAVQPLKAAEWGPEAPRTESPGFAAIAALELLEPERA